MRSDARALARVLGFPQSDRDRPAVGGEAIWRVVDLAHPSFWERSRIKPLLMFQQGEGCALVQIDGSWTHVQLIIIAKEKEELRTRKDVRACA